MSKANCRLQVLNYEMCCQYYNGLQIFDGCLANFPILSGFLVIFFL